MDSIYWQLEKDATITDYPSFDKISLTILGWGIIGVLSEIIIRRTHLSLSAADTLANIRHIIIFLGIPLLYQTKNKIKLFPFFVSSLLIIISVSLLHDTRAPLILLLLLLFIPVYKLQWNLRSIIIGLVTGIIFGLHLYFVSSLSQFFTPQPLEQLSAYDVLFELTIGVIALEYFFRKFIFQQLITHKWSPINASTVTTIFYTLLFLANPRFTSSVALTTGILFYALLVSIIFCWLTLKEKSIVPTIVASFIIALVRLLII